jgi:hypothetical protein
MCRNLAIVHKKVDRKEQGREKGRARACGGEIIF